MARSFTAATTDAVASTQATRFSSRTYCIWSNRAGATAFHRMFENTNNGFFLDTTDTTYRFNQNFSVANGQWAVTAAGTGTWTFCGITWDDTADTNDPSVWINTTKNTIGSGLTEVLTPSGTPLSSHANLRIGNRPDGARSWNGALARFAQWSVILDDDEMVALARGMHPTLIRPASLEEHLELLRDNVSTILAPPTITGTTVSDHPRLLFPTKRKLWHVDAGGAVTYPVSASATAVGTAFLIRQGRLNIVAGAVGTPNVQRQGNLILLARAVGTATVTTQLVKIMSILANAVGRASIQRQGNLTRPIGGGHNQSLQRQCNMSQSAQAAHSVNVGRLTSITINALAASVVTATATFVANLIAIATAVTASIGASVSLAVNRFRAPFTGGATLAYLPVIRRKPWKSRRRA